MSSEPNEESSRETLGFRKRSPLVDHGPSVTVRPGLWLTYAAWFALCASLGEIALLLRSQWLGFRRPEPQFLWWLPTGYLFVMLPVAAVATWLLRGRHSRTTYGWLVGILTFISSYGLLEALHKLHHAAALVLAAGVATQAARWSPGHEPPLTRIIRRTLPGIALISVALAMFSLGRPVFDEWRTLSSLPAASTERPNVLLIVLDTFRARSLSLYGDTRAATPNLDRLAARGVVFERAISTAPWTLPSHGSMFTGHWPHELNVGYVQPLDSRFPTLAEAFTRQGYLTAGFAANYSYVDRDYGLHRGFTHFEGRVNSLRFPVLKTSPGRVLEQAFSVSEWQSHEQKFEARTAAQNNEVFLRWLADRDQGRPFFAFLNYFDTHDPYIVDDEIARRFPGARARYRLEGDLDAHSAQDVEQLHTAYDATVASLDEQLGRLFAALERTGALNRTIVVITADHGEQFGEHGMLLHAASLYTPLIHVPLLISYPPAVPRNRHVQSFVSLRDLAATVLDLAQVPAMQPAFPGHSLRPCWADDAGATCAASALLSEAQRYPWVNVPDWYPARRGALGSIIVDGMQYIRNYGDGQEELYDLRTDLDEHRDLAALPTVDLTRYRQALEAATRTR